MNGKAVILPVSTPVQVTLGADDKGVLSIGIRINGSNQYTMAQAVIVPKAGQSQTWSQEIGNLT
jgi:hypothetical protein